MTVRLALAAVLTLAGCSTGPDFDVVIRGGTVFDGSGAPPVVADVGLRGDTVAVVGDLSGLFGAEEVDAAGLAVSPGFINMLSWAAEPLIQDGRGLSDIVQGVTTEVFGEGSSGGPLTDSMAQAERASQGRIRYDVDWRTFGGFLEGLEQRGVSPNVASFVGASTVREFVLGEADRAPDAGELERMRQLVREAMEEGALGVGAALIYTPGTFASTEELIALAREAAAYDGVYVAHIRSEGFRLLEAVREHLHITEASGARGEIYHLKAAGRANWDKLDGALALIEAARARGVRVAANMYTYTAGSTGLDAAMPPWVQEGGFGAWRQRLSDPAVRRRVAREMTAGTPSYENLLDASGADGALIVGMRQDSLRHLVGKTLAEVAAARGVRPEQAAMDLVIADSSRVQMVYFLMSEDNVRRKVATPWIGFGSDAGALAPEAPFTASSPHPRAYGNFARLLGRYVRDEGLLPLEEAVRRLTSMPADRYGLARRGRLRPGAFADVVVFDPATIRDEATYEEPHQLAVGVQHVWVNGVRVLRDGQHTGATPGRFVRRNGG